MPAFTYTAINARGAEESGRLEAAGAAQAVAELKARGLHPTALAEAGAKRVGGTRPPAGRSWRMPFLNRLGGQDLAVFTRQLATLLKAGLPLVRALETLARQEHHPTLRGVVGALAADIRAGGTLSDALARHPRLFGRLYVNMVRAGEAAGALDPVLDRLARFAEQSLRLRAKVRAALVYPLVVLGVALTILTGLLIFVVPRFQQIFADLLKGAPLPPLTQAVLMASDLVRHHAPLVGAVLVALWIGFRLFRRTAAGGRRVDTWLLRVPVFGELARRAVVARVTRTLGTLLASGVPVLPALLIARDTSGNLRMADALTLVHDRVKAGEPIARPLDESGVFPGMVSSMVDVGEQSGQLPAMLGQVADAYELEVDNAVAGLSSLLEPVLIVVLALVVGVIVIALFLPIVRIVQLLT